MIGSVSWRALMRRNVIYRKRHFVSTILEILLPIVFIFFLVLIKLATKDTDGFSAETVEAEFPTDNDAFVTYSFTDYVKAIQGVRICEEVNVVDFQLDVAELSKVLESDDFKNATTLEEAQKILSAQQNNGEVKYRQEIEISGIRSDGNWQVPFVQCDRRRCAEDGEDARPYCRYLALAVAPARADDEIGRTQASAFRSYIYQRYPQMAVNADDVDNGINTPLPFDFDFVQVFTSNDELENYVKDDGYGTVGKPSLALAIIFDGTDSSVDYSYVIRNNSTGFNLPEEEGAPVARTTPSTNQLFNTYAKSDDSSCNLGDGPKVGSMQNSCTARYAYNGVLVLQRLVGDWIMVDSGAKDAGFFVSENGARYAPFASLEHTENGFFESIQAFMPLLITLGLLFPVSAMIRYIVREKELRQKELMKMMSVTESDINWAWFVSLFSFHIITAFGAAGMTKALFSNSSFGLLLVFWILNMLSIIAFCMALSALFSKSTRATLVGLLIFFLGYFLTEVTSFDEGNAGTISLVSLHPVAAFSYGLREIGRLEDLTVGLTSDTAGSSDNPSGYTFNVSLGSFIIDAVLYGILSWYLNRVIRSDFGQPMPWYFPFTTSYWFPRCTRSRPPTDGTTSNQQAEYDASIPIEPVSDALKAQTKNGTSIEISNLRKTFGEKTAVEGLNLSIFSNQITALLGHNGAGKTTTINMLTGMFAPTSGYATVAGRDIRTDMANIRQNLGVVLQHDCLFPELTVKEHIQFFAAVKGMYTRMSRKEAEEKIEVSIRDVALSEKSHTLSKNLSGGMKRKLSVAIAFCGDSKFVLLDEPTSGMDPFSRRFTWNVIRQYRQNRAIILTTHFMDEADILGDRIAIMAEGRLRCLGSSLFLKKTYGVGYQLTIEKKPPVVAHAYAANSSSTASASTHGKLQETAVLADIQEGSVVEVIAGGKSDASVPSSPRGREQAIDEMLKRIVLGAVPDATILSNVGTELSFQLPLSESHAFESMLEQLDDQIQARNIITFGLGVTTLDEVFQIVARGSSADKEKPEYESSTRIGGSQAALGAAGAGVTISKDAAERSARSRMDLQKDGLFGRHVTALIQKRAMNFKRDKKAWLCTTILPSLFVLIGLVLFKVTDSVQTLDALVLDLDDYNDGVSGIPRNPIQFNSAGSGYTCQPGNCLGESIVNVESTGETSYFCGFQSYIGNTTCTIQQSNEIMAEISAIAGADVIGNDASNTLEASYRISNESKSYAATQYGAVFFTHDSSSTIQGTGTNFGSQAAAACRLNTESYSPNGECDNYNGGIGFVLRYNYTGIHVAPLFQTLADEAIVRRALGQDSFRIRTTIHPLPVTNKERAMGESFNAFSAWLLLILSFPFIAGTFGTFVVAERQSKAKHLQTVAGVKPSAYWISTWLWDIANYTIPATITILLFLAFDVDPFITTNRGVIGGVIALLLLFGPAAASFTYCISFLFTSPSVCNLVVIISSFLIGMGGAIACFVLRLIGGDLGDPNQSLVDAANIIEWVLRFVPSFNLSKGLFNCIYISTFEFLEGRSITVWHERILLYEVIFLGIESIAYLILALKIDQWSSNPRAVNVWRGFLRFVTCRCFCSRDKVDADRPDELPDDNDVVAEQQRVLSGGANDDLIVISELRKVYDNGKIAVNVSLGIPPGQCFGLLGVNGAGKTTTMGMLTAEFPPTSGDATLAGFSVTNEPEKTRRRVGYCPQFDAHFANMSGREHVELYASIKGVPKDAVKHAAAQKLAEVGLSESDSDRLSAGYSGGMKRRLSLACATIGQPQIVFLDECSTGVDPVARREIWQMISDMVTGGDMPPEERTSVILTTHSMEECEALCPNIGIMANGKLRCLGSAQHLKSKFGQGYQVEMKIKIVNNVDQDYAENAARIVEAAGVNLTTTRRASSTRDAELGETGPSVSTDVTFLDFVQTQKALVALAGDNYLADIVSETNPVGYTIYKEANSPTGVSLDALTSFATAELRMRVLHEFIMEQYPGSVLRERQDSKVRYEISSRNIRIAHVFGQIEANKDRLQVGEYGVSQTSLEQVFIQHAAAAERLKHGTIDG